MKFRIASLLLALLLSFVIGCEKPQPVDPEAQGPSFIFGHFFGMCIGEQCVEIFKLENGQLYEDTNDNYPGDQGPYQANFQPLPDSLYQLVKNLPDQLPTQLYAETDTVLGIPDAGDWGGIYLELTDENGDRRFWLIDNKTDNLPAYLQGYKQQINDAIDALQ